MPCVRRCTRRASSRARSVARYTCFNQHLIKSGRFEPATSRLLARLQKFREEADYGEAFVVDEKGAREELEAARGFVDRVVKELGLLSP
jgi:uncharacterized protein (UPF0332 family)